jgi:Uma2 family endonuclease
MSTALRKPMTRDAFFAWAETQDERYEFDGFQPVAVTGGNLRHSDLVGSINSQLRVRLAGKKCRPLGPDAGVATSRNAVRYPDVVVTCTPYDGHDRLVPDPVIVFEVVSPTSVRVDRIVKLNEYQAVPTIRRYVIVEPGAIAVTVHWREQAGDMFSVIGLGDNDILSLPEIDIEISVAAIYEGIDLDEQQDAG